MSAQQMADAYLSGTALDLPDGHFINGRFVAGQGDRMESIDPGLGEAFASFALGGAAEIDAALDSARKAFEMWRLVKPSDRTAILLRCANAIRANADRLALVEAIDSGKTLAEAQGDVASSARLFEYYAGAADKLDGRSVDLGPDYTAFTRREPVGVTAHIIPWNYPTSTFARGVAPALAAGCTVVAKPAETTPFTALLLAEILTEAGVPEGVINVVTGLGRDAGAALVSDPRVNHITFTGSVATGVAVTQAAAPNVTRLTLELGGKSPLVAFADADLEAVADGATWAIFSNAGQICSAGSRLIVERGLRDDLLDRLKEKAEAITFGHGLSNPDMGAINSDLHLGRVAAHVDAARARGCKIVTGGNVATDPKSGKGWFFEPTIIADLSADDPAVQDEIFGPVLSVQVFDTEDEAIRLANGTAFGLMASVYTPDLGRAMRLTQALDSGQVTVNDYWAGGVELPFGGNHKSGYGREKGLEGLEAYTTTKSITIKNASR
jgi:aldehyde dehydrogenase (NAD+)/betaine-aldehyde dehydrogenase